MLPVPGPGPSSSLPSVSSLPSTVHSLYPRSSTWTCFCPSLNPNPNLILLFLNLDLSLNICLSSSLSLRTLVRLPAIRYRLESVQGVLKTDYAPTSSVTEFSPGSVIPGFGAGGSPMIGSFLYG
jgi:hypothetical protein